MNEDTKFLLQRIDATKAEILAEIDELSKKFERHEELKNKLYGIALVCGALGSLVVRIIFTHS